jgi:hypothetical protein
VGKEEAMGLAEKLERLVRIIPGIGGYQDRETSRDTDKLVRLKLSSEIEGLKLEIEKEKRLGMDRNDLSLLPALDTLASKLDKTANLIKYAERGYSGIFDIHKIGQDKLDKLYSFDLALFDGIETLKTVSQGLHDASFEPSAAKEQVRKLDEAIEGFEKKFSTRRDLLKSR